MVAMTTRITGPLSFNELRGSITTRGVITTPMMTVETTPPHEKLVFVGKN